MTMTSFESAFLLKQKMLPLEAYSVLASITLQEEKTWEPAENTTQGHNTDNVQTQGRPIHVEEWAQIPTYEQKALVQLQHP